MELLTDITPLSQVPAFRRLWLGSMLSSTGGAMTTFAMTLQVWEITRSTAAVGGLGVAALVPMLAIALPGGTLADRVDRRKLVLAMTACSTVVSALLFAQALTGLGWLWLLYALEAAASAIGAIGAPARRAFIPALVPAGQRAAAMALNRIVMQTMLIAGPVLAGVVAAGYGVRGCYLIDTASFAGSFYGVAGLPATPASATRDTQRSGLALTVEGLSFIRRSQALAGAFLTDLNATFFALPLSLFPAINAERFGGDPRTLGLFTAAVGAGGMVTAVLSGPLKHIPRHGLGMLVCSAVWGGAFAVFAVAPSLWLTLVALGVAGAADTFTVVFRGVIVQAVTPEQFRGRVNAADYVVGAGGGQLGSLESGLVGSLATPQISALTGGAATILGAAVIGAALPGFRRYREAPAKAGPAPAMAPEEAAVQPGHPGNCPALRRRPPARSASRCPGPHCPGHGLPAYAPRLPSVSGRGKKAGRSCLTPGPAGLRSLPRECRARPHPAPRRGHPGGHLRGRHHGQARPVCGRRDPRLPRGALRQGLGEGQRDRGVPA